MEVHHHSHTPRRKWSHYFWEFFMLFLAVTLGFFVENQREHFVEHKREKQYIRSMIVDLNADTTKLVSIFKTNTRIITGLDSILNNYDQFAAGRYSSVFFRNEAALWGFPDFIYTDRTINQLKSAGMRLIRKQAASDSIIAYDDQARDYLIEQEATSYILRTMTNEYNHLLNRRLLKTEFTKEHPFAEGTDILLTHDKQKVEGFYNLINMYKNALSSRKYDIVIVKNSAARLINFLKEEYHIH